MKYLKRFNTFSEFTSFKDSNEYIDPNVSAVGNKGRVKFSSGLESGLKLCDIIYWDGENVCSTPKGTWQSTFGIPLGVVVIPEGYAPDGNARVMSLKMVDKDGFPTEEKNNLSWDTSIEIINTPLKDFYNYIAPTYDSETDEVILGNASFMPSTKFGGIQAVNDNKAYYTPGAESGLVISPYRNDYADPNFYSSPETYFSDFDGLNNTLTLVTLGEQYQAANAAWNYTDGVGKFQWYLPSMGELGYMFARLKEIDETILEVGGVSPMSVFSTGMLGSNYMLSSTERNRNIMYCLDMTFGISDILNKSFIGTVYPFTMMSATQDISKLLPEYSIKTGAQVGDVAYVSNPSSPISYRMVRFTSIDEWNDSKGEPIGIVVIPKEHTPDGLVRIIPLTQTVGNVTYMSWGGSEDTTLKNFNAVPIMRDDNMGLNSMTYVNGGNMPSDIYDGAIDPVTDSKSSYYNNVTANLIPSPYSGDAKNSLYSDYVTGSNALSDFDGLSNTEVLVGLGSGYTAANACWNYNDGYSKLQWYLPAMGELGYMLARTNLIKRSFSKLTGFSFGSKNFWSSTEASYSYAWGISETGVCKGVTKTSKYCPLAFAKLQEINHTFIPSFNQNMTISEGSYLKSGRVSEDIIGKYEFLDVAYWEDEKIKVTSLPEYIKYPMGTLLGFVVIPFGSSKSEARIIDFNLIKNKKWSTEKKNNTGIYNYTEKSDVIKSEIGLENTKSAVSFGGSKYPAAYSAYNYDKKGSNLQWYLPAMGELYLLHEFLYGYFKEENDNYTARKILLDNFNIDMDTISFDLQYYQVWSSNEYDRTKAWGAQVFTPNMSTYKEDKKDVIAGINVIPMAMLPNNRKIGNTEIKVAYWDGSGVKTIYYSKWDKSLGTPIGVVVVPEGFASDACARIIALTPVDENGFSTHGNVRMTWGPYGEDTTLNENTLVPLVDDYSFSNNNSGKHGFLPMMGDYNGILSWFDLKSNYMGYPNIPSPYLGNSPNVEYIKDVGGYNVLSDFNGLSNTETLVGLGDDYIAANTAYKYKDGYSNLQWYLPAMGELGYIMPKLSEINNVINNLGGKIIESYEPLWSSNPSGYYNAFSLYVGTGLVTGNDRKDNTYLCVRPFAKLNG